MQILNLGEIGLVESMGNDRKIAQAAWVSYGKQDSERTDDEVARVIRYMMQHRHGTPFEHVVFTFYVKCPIFVMREWIRHRIGSFNEISGRYKTLAAEYYVPEVFRIKGSSNKQGSILPDDDWLETHGWMDAEDFNQEMAEDLTIAYDKAYDSYQSLLAEGIANEIARVILPVGIYTQFWWTLNLRSLLNFMSLRSAENAQWEIQQYSKALEEIVKEIVPQAYDAWIENGRLAP
jgi:thymidylate synthase (FAD)